MKSISSLLLLSLLSIFVLAWCSTRGPDITVEPNDSIDTTQRTLPKSSQDIENWKPLNIVTTFPPLYAHAINIADANDIITNLVPAWTSVHFWQPKPSDIVAMESADIIITNGLWLEEFLEDYLEWLEDAGVLIVDTSDGIETLSFWNGEEDHNDHKNHEEDHHDEHEGEGHDEEHEDEEHYDKHHHHEWPDPHIWLDTNNAIIQSTTITNSLIELDSSQEVAYTKSLEMYTNSIQALDEEIQSTRQWKQVKPFVVFHDAYQYFLTAYDLTDSQVWLVQEFHGDSPSQRQIAELIEIIINQWVKTIYTEPQFNPSVAQRLQEETGVTIQEVDPIGSDLSKDWYIITMQNLSKAFIQ